MLRAAFLALSLLSAVPVLAEQAGGSGLPAPENRKEWIRAVQSRVEANASARFWAQGQRDSSMKDKTAKIQFIVHPDGGIADVEMVEASAGLSEQARKRLVAAIEDVPRLPTFTPDMQQKPITILLPLNLD
ncbi:TonB C-terminal domain-containing protein [Paracoccus sp. CPCC 101403]|uniref:TonB C-terminal domain-containing protein n=1 Tax=Paracoccus broussonetiae TaxID=3075834 RepID=A0ABU3EB30_9RHOB|nr:TonB C-terminal domain-containing protein [Paracoccus sp. CPCC 101403]MDT1061409.1 TonB C-terminal domain-containing protein [Paracoccus sp. CPCC 101403]